MKLPMLMKVLAIAALAGQLEPLPVAVACALRHPAWVATCDDHVRSSGPSISSVSVASSSGIAACIALPCAAAGSGAVPSFVDASFAPRSHAVALPAQAVRPVSFAAAPIPPPPEA